MRRESRISSVAASLLIFITLAGIVPATATVVMDWAQVEDINIAGIARSGDSGAYRYKVIGSANRPVTYVGWFDAARMANWIHNGQGDGCTETGVYNLNGATSGVSFTTCESS